MYKGRKFKRAHGRERLFRRFDAKAAFHRYIPACSFFEGCFYDERRNVIGTVKYRW